MKLEQKSLSKYQLILISLLTSYKVSIVVETSFLKDKKENVLLTSEANLSKINAIVTVGGDGTILSAQKYYKHSCIPPIIAFYLVRVIYYA